MNFKEYLLNENVAQAPYQKLVDELGYRLASSGKLAPNVDLTKQTLENATRAIAKDIYDSYERHERELQAQNQLPQHDETLD